LIVHKRYFHSLLPLLALVLFGMELKAQKPSVLEGIKNRIPTGASGGGGGNDSLRTRNRFEDSVTLTIYYLDSVRGSKPDSSISDFYRRFPLSPFDIYLGNLGTASKSLLFSPSLAAGWDAGFHAFDAYKFSLQKIRFFNTTRPYTELGYMLGSRAEQTIDIFHTQNIKPYWNASFQYRLINAPGQFRNQKTNHNNYQFTSWYQSKNKRYNNYLALVGNRLQGGENGGILQDQDYLNEIDYARDRFIIPTRIGGNPTYGTDFFSNDMATGNRYNEFNILIRQQYDFGQKDSLVTDSTVLPLFYPRLRFEHTFKYGTYKYTYEDRIATGRSTNEPDSAYYRNNYGIVFNPGESFYVRDQWKEISNDFSVYQYPDAKNLSQFIRLGAEVQLLNGKFYQDSSYKADASLYNLAAHGEYRNRTKNQKWDLQANGILYLNGYNLGDYHAIIRLQRLISQRFGSVSAGFENSNRKPAFIFDERSGFYFDDPKNFSKENTSHFFGSVILPRLRLQLGADYYLIGNYTYLADYRRLKQESSIFNFLRINARKTFPIGRHWFWDVEVHVQQKTGNAEINLPLAVTRQRFMYEGNFGLKNLNISFGIEGRYYTPYDADDYSPVLGRFMYQDSVKIKNLPDVAGFLHFRIRSFKAYLRAENINTARNFGGLQFNNNNLAAPNYPTQGLWIRFGIYWTFVN